jgi:hypothetical protein
MRSYLFALLFIAIIGMVFGAMGDFGCGSGGQCWTWCDGGAGWCYTGFSCNFKGDCDSNAACRLPRVCNHEW